MEKIRQSASFQNIIINTFKSSDNYKYLYKLFYDNLLKMGISPTMAQNKLSNLYLDMVSYSTQYGTINGIIQSDDIAMRSKSGLTLWNEIKRINLVFYKTQMNNYINNIYNNNIASYLIPDTKNMYSNNRYETYGVVPPLPQIPNKLHAKNIEAIYDQYPSDKYVNVNPYNKLLDHVPIVGNVENNEDYAMTMFTSDSLQPEGCEYLNNMGPKYEVLENQYWWDDKFGYKKYNPIPPGSKKTGTEDDEVQFQFIPNNTFYNPENNMINSHDDTYRNEYNVLKSIEKPTVQIRTAEDLIYELMGENYVDTETVLRNESRNAKLKNERKKINSGDSNSEAFRYKTIPFWQKINREGVDTDLEGTLGFGMKESNNHVRGWNMDSIRKL
jgi:hypothetical protein